MTYFSGGYYIVTPIKRPDYMDKELIPENVLSLSECICDLHPEINAFGEHSEEAKYKYIQQLKIPQSTYEEMKQWVNEKYADGTFGFPRVFATKELAKEFLCKFLYNSTEAKIFGLGLAEEYVKGFLEIEEFKGNEYGIENLLNSRTPVEEKDLKMIGYEVLGFDYGNFHSYLCNSLEKDYKKYFGFKLNENGFISTIEEAVRFCDYTNDDEVGAEPVLWLPWAIFEYKI